MKIKLLVEGGNMTPGPALAQKLGPLGINIGKVISKVNEATSEFKGTKVPVDLDVDVSTKEFHIIVKSPPVSELIKKELKLEKGSGDHKKLKAGNIAIEQIIKIAKAKLPDALEKNLKAMVKTVVGSCVSLGVLVEDKEPIEISEDIEKGKYDNEINQEKTDLDPAKKEKLDKFFAVLHKKQEAVIEEAKAAEKAKAEEGEKPVEEKLEEKKEEAGETKNAKEKS